MGVGDQHFQTKTGLLGNAFLENSLQETSTRMAENESTKTLKSWIQSCAPYSKAHI